MKKLFAVSCLVLFAAVAVNAQEYKKFRVGLGAGYAMPGGKGAKGGVMIAVEPGFRITDRLLTGLRFETAAVVRGSVTETSAELDVAAIGSYVATTQYYFPLPGKFRVFSGGGAGLFSLAAVSIEGNSGGGSADAAAAESKFGGIVRSGFEIGHFNFTIDYNLIPKTEGAGGTEFKNSYVGFRIGGFFGGGRK